MEQNILPFGACGFNGFAKLHGPAKPVFEIPAIINALLQIFRMIGGKAIMLASVSKQTLEIGFVSPISKIYWKSYQQKGFGG